jgi:hypothetical protein
VFALALATGGGSLFVGGNFAQVGAVPRLRLAKILTSAGAALDPGWNPGADATVRALLPDAEGRLYVGGLFDQVAGSGSPRLARLLAAGAIDAGWNPGVVGDDVRALSAVGSQWILVGGRFSSAGAAQRWGVAQLATADASADPGFAPFADGGVAAAVLASGGRPVVGGDFVAIGGQERIGLAMFEGSDTLFANGFD